MSISKHRLSSDIAQVDDLLLDGSDIYVYARRPDDQTAILTDLRTGEEMSFAPERILAMKLIIPGAIIQTGGEPHHIVDVSETHHITYTSGGGGEPQGMPPVFYADTLAAVRRRNYGTVGNQQAVNDELDAAADAVLDDVGEPDLAADAALPELLNDDLPPADEEELPPGEPQPLPEDVARYQKGDRLWTPAGREYRVMSVDHDFVRVKHESGDLYIPHAEMPSLLREHPVLAAAVEPNWEDEVVRISAELIQARQRIAQLEDELARLHDESRDTEPLAPETVAEAVRASQELARVEVVRWDDVKVESWTLPPIDLFVPSSRLERDQLIAQFRNEGWFVVYESASAVTYGADELAHLYHVARLERSIEDDDPRGDGQPDQRDIIDQALDVVDAYEPAEQPEDADSEDIVTETDLTPVERLDAGHFPITEAIRQRGLAAVMDAMDADLIATFNQSRSAVGAHHDAPMIIAGGQS